MESDYYEFASAKGVLSLARNKKLPYLWDFYFNDQLIHSRYNDPYQAALDASNSDFGIPWLDDFMNKVYVPSDIRQWRTFKGMRRKDSESYTNN